jgi:hypothetical protein
MGFNSNTLPDIVTENPVDCTAAHAVVGGNGTVWSARVITNSADLLWRQLGSCFDSLAGVLLFCCRPATIFRRVIAIGIDAVDALFVGWSLAHVGKKVGETVGSRPAFADFDPATSVQRILRIFRVVAPLVHVVPRFVLGSHFPVFHGQSVCSGHVASYHGRA